MNKKRLTALTLAGVMALGMFTGCAGDESSPKDENTLFIGAIAPLTGGASDYGITATNGLKLAVEEVNANGGVLGRQAWLPCGVRLPASPPSAYPPRRPRTPCP